MSDNITIIKPAKTFSFDDIKEVWSYRELLYFLAWRDIKVRYKQTLIGIGWALFQPLFAMIIFTIFFGYFVKMPTDNIPYPIFVYVGLILWQFFSGALTDISNSLIQNKEMLTKIYFPRLILPISATISKFLDFLVASLLLVGLMLYFGYTPRLSGLAILPLLIIIMFFASLGLGLFLSSLNVKYRDVKFVLPFFIQMMFFITPVVYPASLTGVYSWFLAMNPMTGVIKAARSALLGDFPMNWLQLGISSCACFLIFLIGLYYFKKTEKYFADIV